VDAVHLQHIFMKNWTVYILNCNDGTYYVGCTSNLDDRISKHEKGYVKSTKNRIPVTIATTIVFTDKYKAFEFEKYLKTGSGRAFMNKRLI
jgi:putative endonuclease